MKITSMKTFIVDVTQRGNWVFVRLNTDAGITGIGEASQGGNDVHTLKALQDIEPMVIGHNPFNIEAFHQCCYREDEGRPFHTAVSGIEHAFWDIVGKVLNTPVYNLLGGRCRDKIRLYANINRATWDRSPSGFARNAKAAVLDGFTAIKCAPFDAVSHGELARTDGNSSEMRRVIDTGIERIRQVRAAVGDEIDLLVDCHGRFTPSMAIQVAKELEDVNLFWFEAPIPSTDFEAIAKVKAEAPMPIAFGENLRTKSLFQEALEKQAMNILMPDVKHTGGILELKKISALAESVKIPIAPHNPSGPVATAASVQCMTSVPNFLILEHAWGEVPWRSELIIEPEKIEHGFIEISDKPGLGIELNDEVVGEHILHSEV
ncbi:TPA: mandelate racemase/muconate lactonizing enzyme family protein [Candidatus Poribacteria bacterium]|nr:mandelate racemase/muconate lactonizing enzyme family protein [Candidatus Poribacteria bacterium]